MTNETPRTLYPIHLDVRGATVVVFGGGSVASRRVRRLLEAGARIRLVAPKIVDSLRERVNNGEVDWVTARADATHLEGARLAFAATDDGAVNAAVESWCRDAGVWINRADEVAAGAFHVPEVRRYGRVTVSVGTSGAAPALAVALADRVERAIGGSAAQAAAFAADLRGRLAQSGVSVPRAIWTALLSEEFFAAAARDDERSMRAAVRSAFGVSGGGDSDGETE